MASRNILAWITSALALAIVLTGLAQVLLRQLERLLPTWTLNEAKQRFARIYPNLEIHLAIRQMLLRDQSFSRMLRFLPWQCLLALLALAGLWNFFLPASPAFWLAGVQTLFLIEFFILALYPAFRILQKMQRLTIARAHELLKEK